MNKRTIDLQNLVTKNSYASFFWHGFWEHIFIFSALVRMRIPMSCRLYLDDAVCSDAPTKKEPGARNVGGGTICCTRKSN